MNLSDVYETLLTVDAPTTMSGIASAGMLVKPGAVLTASGIISGPLTVEPGGQVKLSGILNGALQVHAEGHVDITGILNGPVIGNEGIISVAVGAIVQGGRLTGDGSFTRADTANPVGITDATPRFQLRGVSPGLQVGST